MDHRVDRPIATPDVEYASRWQYGSDLACQDFSATGEDELAVAPS
jgi:hypothetical protein